MEKRRHASNICACIADEEEESFQSAFHLIKYAICINLRPLKVSSFWTGFFSTYNLGTKLVFNDTNLCEGGNDKIL